VDRQRPPARLLTQPIFHGGELSGALGLSAHNRKQPYQFSNALNVMSFVDGHVSYIRIYWDGTNGFDGIPGFYNPPAGYEYEWFAN
jgi:prepilin-type processing-associated H-X9-DG protein